MVPHKGQYGGVIQSPSGLCSSLPSVALQPGAGSSHLAFLCLSFLVCS